MRCFVAAAAAFAALALPYGFAQTGCRGTTLAGTVRDSTLALIPGATITLDGTLKTTSGEDGRFQLRCVGDGPHRLSTTAAGFASRDASITAPHAGAVDLVLKPEEVETQMSVSGSDDGAA